MSITWKPGDRAVFCYRPDVPRIIWDEETLSYVGQTGMVTGLPFPDPINSRFSRVKFLFQNSGVREPITCLLAPLVEGPRREAECDTVKVQHLGGVDLLRNLVRQ